MNTFLILLQLIFFINLLYISADAPAPEYFLFTGIRLYLAYCVCFTIYHLRIYHNIFFYIIFIYHNMLKTKKN